jgi:hypothetical protein
MSPMNKINVKSSKLLSEKAKSDLIPLKYLISLCLEWTRPSSRITDVASRVYNTYLTRNFDCLKGCFMVFNKLRLSWIPLQVRIWACC